MAQSKHNWEFVARLGRNAWGDGPSPFWLSLSLFCKEEWWKVSVWCKKVVEPNPKTLASATATNQMTANAFSDFYFLKVTKLLFSFSLRMCTNALFKINLTKRMLLFVDLTNKICRLNTFAITTLKCAVWS